MSEIKTAKNKPELEEPEPEQELEPYEEEEEEQPVSLAQIERVDSKSEQARIFIELPRKLWQRVQKYADMMDVTKREFTIQALTRFMSQLDDTSAIDSVLAKTDSVDEILAELKQKGVTILTPKAIHKLREALQKKWCYSLDCDKFTEFCRKVGLDRDEAENPVYAFIIKWK
jgi:hypothetical protein